MTVKKCRVQLFVVLRFSLHSGCMYTRVCATCYAVRNNGVILNEWSGNWQYKCHTPASLTWYLACNPPFPPEFPTWCLFFLNTCMKNVDTNFYQTDSWCKTYRIWICVCNCMQCYDIIRYKLVHKTCTVKLSIRLSTTPRPEAPRVLYISTVYSGCILHLHSLVPGGKVRSAQ
jgi:hypothetical protein